MVLGIFPLSICFRPTTSDLYTYCPSSYQNVPCSVFPIQISIPLFSFIDKKNTLFTTDQLPQPLSKAWFRSSSVILTFSPSHFLLLSLTLSFSFLLHFSYFLIPSPISLSLFPLCHCYLYHFYSSV